MPHALSSAMPSERGSGAVGDLGRRNKDPTEALTPVC